MTTLVFQNRWEVIYAELRERILSADLPPGSQIFELELAQLYGVSRGTVREALRELQLAGLVVRGPHRPTFVAPATRDDIQEVFRLRAAIEVIAVERAIGVADPSFLRTLRARSDAVEEAIARDSSTKEIVEADISFVTTFYEFAHSRRLSAIWASLADPLRAMLYFGLARHDPQWKSGWSGHAEIVDAAEARDTPLAVKLVRERIEGGGRGLLDYVAGR